MIYADIRDHWDRIRPAIQSILDAPDEVPDEVYHKCRSGHAHLFTNEDGFMVLKELAGDDGAKELFVWCCHSTATDGLSKYLPDIEAIARDINAKRIVMRTRRRGFERVPGWDIRHTEYAREV